MKFKIGERTYDAATLGKPELGDYLRLEQETAALGRRISAVDAETISNDIASLKSDEDRKRHPDTVWLIALNIWAAMCHAANQARDSGQAAAPARFEDALRVSLDDLVFLPDPEDHKEPENPRKPRAGRGSARGAGNPAAKRAAKTSRKRSSPAS